MGKKDYTSGDQLTTMNVVGILALFCCMSEFAILTPSIAAFAKHFVGTDITTIMFANSITGIVSVPVSIIMGAELSRFGFRKTGIVGILVMTLGGAFPFLLPNITNYLYVIVSRIIVGIGLGIMFPVGNATIIAFFDGEKRSRYLGLGLTIQFLFNLLYTTVAGFLTEIAWNFSFLAYLIGFIPLIFVAIWMPEARGVVQAKEAKDPALGLKGPKEPVPKAIWGYAIYALVGWTCVVTVQVVTSSVLDARQLASSGVASLVINCCGIGSILCGLVFPYTVRLLKGRTFGVSAVLIVLGIIPCLVADNVYLYALGVFILGFGGSTFFTAAQNATGNLSPKTRVPFVSGVMTSMMNLGPFIGPYIFSWSMVANPAMGLDAIFPVLIVMGAFCAVVGLIHPMRALSIEKADEPED